jgi:hypothetical protein
MTPRIMLFDNFPNTILILADDGELELPPLISPFTKPEVASAIGEVGMLARVSTSKMAGRYTGSIDRLINAKKSEVVQKANLQEVTQRANLDTKDMDRATLLQEKYEIDEKLRQAKVELAETRRARFIPKTQYRAITGEIENLKQHQQALQVALAKSKQPNQVPQMFMDAARIMLEPEVFRMILDEAHRKD